MKGNAEHQPAIYHHGRVAGYFSPIILACAALAFVEFMRLLTEGEALESPGLMLVFGAATVLVVWLAKIWYDWTKQAILCTEQGLVLLNDRKCRYRLIPWEELATACELRDEKKDIPFLVISREALTARQAKALSRRGEYRLTIAMEVDGTIFLNCDESKYYEAFVAELQFYTGEKFYREAPRPQIPLDVG